MADMTITTTQVRNDYIHPCVTAEYEVAAANTIAVGDVVAVSGNKVVKAVAQTTDLRIAITAGTAGEFVETIIHGGYKLDSVNYNSLAITPTVGTYQ